MGFGYGMMGGWGGFGRIFMFFWWAIIIALVVGGIRWLFADHFNDRGGHALLPPAKTHLDIFKERYARGEIDRDTYERMRRDLGG